METLLLDPQTESKAETSVRPVRSAAGRSVGGAPSWKEKPESSGAATAKTPPSATPSAAAEIRVYPCGGWAVSLAIPLAVLLVLCTHNIKVRHPSEQTSHKIIIKAFVRREGQHFYS